MNEHTVVRLEMATDIGFDELRKAYETVVPPFDLGDLAPLVARRASWNEVVQRLDDIAPHGFVRYWQADVGPVMSLAGIERKCTTYLMGNHVIAERMFRIDPRAMLYAPVRTLLYQRSTGEACFVCDQPSTLLKSLGNDEISEVGRQIDGKLAELLEALEIRSPQQLRQEK